MNAQNYVPGSILKVWSTRYNVFHYGVVDWPSAFGQPRILHSPKGGKLCSTALNEFTEGNTPEPTWVPHSREEQVSIISGMRQQIGKPYDLLTANCEHVVSLAATGRSYSPQLQAACFFVAFLAVVLHFVSSNTN